VRQDFDVLMLGVGMAYMCAKYPLALQTVVSDIPVEPTVPS